MLRTADEDLDFDAGFVEDFIWLGSESAAIKSLDELKKRNIGYVLTVGEGMEPFFPDDLTYKVLNVIDEPKEFLFRFFAESKVFIDEAKEKGVNILVHCAAGRSRSTTIVCSYLMLTKQCDAYEATELARKNRQFAQPNTGFMFQLRLLERLNFLIPSCDEAILMYESADDELRRALLEYAILSNNQRIRSSMEIEAEHNRKHKIVKFSGTHNGVDFSVESFGMRSILPNTAYSCASCHEKLVSEGDIFHHKIYPMHSFLHYMFKAKNVTGCRFRFIPYFAWMGEIDTADGDIFCPHCKHTIGGYVWDGRGCSCGVFMRPAFYLETAETE